MQTFKTICLTNFNGKVGWKLSGDITCENVIECYCDLHVQMLTRFVNGMDLTRLGCDANYVIAILGHQTHKLWWLTITCDYNM
jgi:hypothetical protein